MTTSEKRGVELSDEQIEFLRSSLDYSAQKFRDYDYSAQDQEWAYQHRKEKLAMIDSIREALAQDRPDRKG